MNIIDEAGELNKKCKELERQLEKKKKEIKETGEGTTEGDKYVAIVSKRVRQRKINQKKAFEVVNKIGAKWLLTQVVDEEKLEEALVTGEVDAEAFTDCLETTYSTVITFKEKKK